MRFDFYRTFPFSECKERRRQFYNWHVIVLFRNKTGMHQIKTVAGRANIDPKTIQWAFKDATKNPYGYLILDLRPDTPEELQILSNVLHEDDSPTYVYMK